MDDDAAVIAEYPDRGIVVVSVVGHADRHVYRVYRDEDLLGEYATMGDVGRQLRLG